MSQGIYKITNKINNKCYIGKSQNIQERWKQHLYDYKINRYPDKPLYKAFLKYDILNFEFQIIEKIQNYTKEISNERQKYWIQYYNSYGSTGYNATKGGDGGSTYNVRQKMGKLSQKEVIYLRKRYTECKYPGRLIYDKQFKNKISKRGFEAIWTGQNGKNIMPQVFTKQNKQKQQKLISAYNGVLRRRISLEEIYQVRKLITQGKTYREIWKEKYKNIYSEGGFRDVIKTKHFDEEINVDEIQPLLPSLSYGNVKFPFT